MAERDSMASAAVIDPRAFSQTLEPRRFAKGHVLFSRGEPGDGAYYLASGEVVFPEAGARIGPGQLFGEFSLFNEGHERTATAICDTDVEIFLLDEAAVIAAFRKDPEFAFALVRLVVQRMSQNAEWLERQLAMVRDTVPLRS